MTVRKQSRIGCKHLINSFKKEANINDIELGLALALKKKIYLCSLTKEEFSIENTVAFYELPEIIKLIGTTDNNISQILNYEKGHLNRKHLPKLS